MRGMLTATGHVYEFFMRVGCDGLQRALEQAECACERPGGWVEAASAGVAGAD